MSDSVCEDLAFLRDNIDAFDDDIDIFTPASKSFVVDSKPSESLIQTLQKYFGFPSFRGEQALVINALLSGRDVSAIWATGSGKSICYQLPALHTNKPAIIISPLISLMEDQCNKLNALSKGKKIATFLGTSQQDMSEYNAAMQGEYLLVYVTPEKLSSDGFIDQIILLREKKGLSLIAVDEAHCISEWGNDFRPAYRQINQIRANSSLSDVPLLAVTATAPDKVRQDIENQMKLQNPLVSVTSFDRSNLRISFLQKPALPESFQNLIATVKSNPSNNSTIIYTPTKKGTEKIVEFLRNSFQGTEIKVSPYHAGLNFQTRRDAHLGFLVGEITIIVATVAFGMGIDKPDIRRIIHYGSPKTMEEYYQQIGRAGRDGAFAEVIMYANEVDFAKYHGDFYMGNLDRSSKNNILESLDYLKRMAFNLRDCRRASILLYFGETPAFGNRCGNCDNCLTFKKFGDEQREFPHVLPILAAMQAVPNSPMSVIETLVSGKDTQVHRYRCCTPKEAADRIAREKEKIPGGFIAKYLKEFVPLLVSEKYVAQSSKKGPYQAYTIYSLTLKGQKALEDGIPLLLPLPPAVRKEEEKKKAHLKQQLEVIEMNGIDIARIPEEELASGKGPLFDSILQYVQAVKWKGDVVKNLKDRIFKWRGEMSVQFAVAPVNVVQDHLIYRICTSSRNTIMSKQVLEELGIRLGSEQLSEIIRNWGKEFQIDQGEAQSSITLPTVFRCEVPWIHANKLQGPWRVSMDRFCAGESMGAIAVTQPKKAILPITVLKHILEGIPYGLHAVPLHRIQIEFAVPTIEEIESCIHAEEVTGINVVDNPNFKLNEFIVPIVGAELGSVPYKERTPEQREKLLNAYNICSWYCAIRRANIPYENSCTKPSLLEKRQREFKSEESTPKKPRLVSQL